MLDEAQRRYAGPKHLDKVWLNVLLDADHRIVVQSRLPGGAWKAYVPVANFPESAGFGWPVTLKAHPNIKDDWEVVLHDEEDWPTSATVFDIKDVNFKAAPIVWKSVYNQKCDYGKEASEWPKAVRCFTKGKFKKLHETLAEACFYQIAYSILEDICVLLRIEYPAGASLFELLWIMVSSILKLPDEAVLQILYKRMTKLDVQLAWAEYVEELDDALDVFEEADRRVLLEEKKRNRSVGTDRADYRKAYMQKAKGVYKKKVAAGGKKKGVDGAKASLMKHYEGDFQVSQAQAKLWAPPGGHVWRSVTGKAGWNGHLQPNPRCSCKFNVNDVSCKEALRRVLVNMWDQHLSMHGQEWDECPVDLKK